MVNIFSIINDKLQEQLITSINATNEHDKLKHFRLVKKLYKSCMDTSKFLQSWLFFFNCAELR